jgi:hypothetical protein
MAFIILIMFIATIVVFAPLAITFGREPRVTARCGHACRCHGIRN